MTYNPNIPAANDNISVSQGQIQTNFQQLNTIFNNDHYAWNDATFGGAFRGNHRQIYFPIPNAADPVLGGALSVFFSKADVNDAANRPQLYFRNQTTTYQVTNRFQSANTNGYVDLIGGIFFMWGTFGGPFTTITPITFNTITNYVGAPANSFPTNCFNVQVTIQVNDATQKTGNIQPGSITAGGFSVELFSTSISAINWFAIGN